MLQLARLTYVKTAPAFRGRTGSYGTSNHQRPISPAWRLDDNHFHDRPIPDARRLSSAPAQRFDEIVDDGAHPRLPGLDHQTETQIGRGRDVRAAVLTGHAL